MSNINISNAKPSETPLADLKDLNQVRVPQSPNCGTSFKIPVFFFARPFWVQKIYKLLLIILINY